MAKYIYQGISSVNGEIYRKLRREAIERTGNSEIKSSADFIHTVGSGSSSDIAESSIKMLVREVENIIEDLGNVSEVGTPEQHSEFDAAVASLFYSHLHQLPAAVLVDHDFWRYISVHCLFDVINWRFPADNGDRWGNNNSQFVRCASYSLFVRGQIESQCTPKEIEILNSVTDIDIWTSHIIATLYGSAKSIVLPFMEICRNLKSPKGTYTEFDRLLIRELAKRLKLMRSNYIVDLIDLDTGKFIVKSQIPISETLAKERKIINEAKRQIRKIQEKSNSVKLVDEEL